MGDSFDPPPSRRQAAGKSPPTSVPSNRCFPPDEAPAPDGMSRSVPFRVPNEGPGSACPTTGVPTKWTYNRIGNRMSELDGDGTDTYLYVGGNDASPRIQRIILPNGALKTYLHDAAGSVLRINQPGEHRQRMVYGDDGRVNSLRRTIKRDTVITDEAKTTYDGRGFLASSVREVPAWNSSENVYPSYSSDGTLHHLRRIESAFAFNIWDNYVFYFGGRPIGTLERSAHNGDIWNYLTTDHLGTPAMATDTTGTTRWSGGFEPFGRDYQAGTTSGALENGVFLRLPGQWDDKSWDGVTGSSEYYYNVHRWYESGTGRYSRPDPIVRLKPTFHYLYPVNPLAGVDPTGLCMRQQQIQVPGGPLRWVQVPCDSKARLCGTNLDSPSFGGLTKPCGSDCDPKKISEAAQGNRAKANIACGDLARDKPFESRGGGKNTGWIDDYGYTWHLPSGDDCVDSCVCAHETLHLWQVNTDRARGTRTTIGQKECGSYDFGAACLERFLRGTN